MVYVKTIFIVWFYLIKRIQTYSNNFSSYREKEVSKMDDVVIVIPENSDANDFVRTRQCIDIVVSDVVERERMFK